MHDNEQMPSADLSLRSIHAVGWGWLAGMTGWTILFAAGALANPSIESLGRIIGFLAIVAVIQSILMLPGIIVFFLWYHLVPTEFSNWSSAIPLGLITGPAVLVGLAMIEGKTGAVLDPQAWLWGGVTLPVSLTTFLRGAHYRGAIPETVEESA